MKWSWKIARIAGIDIYIHATFFLLIYLVGISYWNQQGNLAAVVSGIGFILALFDCVVLHELGHSLTARRYGIQTRNITLLPIGGVAALERMPDDPRQEIHVALAGPAVNFLIAFALYMYLALRNIPITAEEVSVTGGSYLYSLMIMNIFLGGFNLLPAFPMDGGRVLRAVLALRMDHAVATRKAASVGQLLALGLGLLGLIYNPYLVFIAVFIWFGAAMENNAEQLKSILDGATVRHAMLSEFHTLSPEDTLAKAVELTLAGSQKDFPVGYTNRLTSVLHHSDLIKGLHEKGPNARICDLALQDILTADINEPLGKLLERMQGHPAQMICVMDNGQVVGLLNLENILELMKMHDAIGKHKVSLPARH
jgi:Zn-dependent protease/predicted transcriptional regulator